jgi:hypothetical protein
MMYFDEQTISRGLDKLAVKWIAKYEKFEPAPVAVPKRDWLYVSDSVPFSSKEPENAPETLETTPKPPLSIHTIRAAVMKVCQLSENEFNSDRHSHYIVRPRQYFYYLCKKHTTRSFPEIGKRAGRKDHSTVMHGVQKIKAMIEARDAKTLVLLSAIEKELGVGK